MREPLIKTTTVRNDGGNREKIYENAFWTLMNDCGNLIVPVINEVLGEAYTRDEKINFISNKAFWIDGDEAKKFHIAWYESGPADSRRILLDIQVQIVRDEGTIEGTAQVASFMNNVVLLLRDDGNTSDKMHYEMETPVGTVKYDVPVVKLRDYTLDEIFDKDLLMLVPFYIFNHEKDFLEYEQDEQRLGMLTAEYKEIVTRLDKLEQEGKLSVCDKRKILELTDAVMKELTV